MPFYSRPAIAMPVSPQSATMLYNGMIAPLVPYTVRGVIWYQGESNTNKPHLYRSLFPAMIRDWRKKFVNPGMPFYFVQIAPYEYGARVHSELLREAQLMSLSLDHTGMAVTLDIGNTKNIHPANKQAVGERLARWAFAKTYRYNLAYSGPLPYTTKVRNDRIILTMKNAERGLKLMLREGKNGFQVAGGDRKFVDANVKVERYRLVVSSPEVPHPVAVRYAFSNTSEATLFNSAGLPAPSFRTDDW
jgi:sialate O-acetylesterase